MDSAAMPSFQTATEWTAEVERAPDGSLVRPLARLAGLGSVASFELPAGAVSVAVQHATVAEIWYVLSGAGELWRRQADREETITLRPGVCATLPAGTAFQFRAHPAAPERSPAGPDGPAPDGTADPAGVATAGPAQPLR